MIINGKIQNGNHDYINGELEVGRERWDKKMVTLNLFAIVRYRMDCVQQSLCEHVDVLVVCTLRQFQQPCTHSLKISTTLLSIANFSECFQYIYINCAL